MKLVFDATGAPPPDDDDPDRIRQPDYPHVYSEFPDAKPRYRTERCPHGMARDPHCHCSICDDEPTAPRNGTCRSKSTETRGRRP